MLPEVEARADKLVRVYSEVEARIQAVVANYVASPQPTRRDRSRATSLVRKSSATSLASRMSEGTALLRLAYVRGGRSVNQAFTMDDADLEALSGLTGEFLRKLRAGEHAVLVQAQSTFRCVGLERQARTLASDGRMNFVTMADFFAAKASGTPGKPLEQYVRGAATLASAQAFTQGETSATERYS